MTRIKLLAECYANKCVASELRRLIMELLGSSISNPIHNPKMGRDRVVKKILTSDTPMALAVIDYEKGMSRVYIDQQFNIIDRIEDTILLGISRRNPRRISVIFDPNIEEAFLCKKIKTLCSNREYYETIKSEKACSIINKYLDNKQIRNTLTVLAHRLASILKRP